MQASGPELPELSYYRTFTTWNIQEDTPHAPVIPDNNVTDIFVQLQTIQQVIILSVIVKNTEKNNSYEHRLDKVNLCLLGFNSRFPRPTATILSPFLRFHRSESITTLFVLLFRSHEYHLVLPRHLRTCNTGHSMSRTPIGPTYIHLKAFQLCIANIRRRKLHGKREPSHSEE